MSSNNLRLFVDTADPACWERFQKRGWVYGATTNPLILKREGRDIGRETSKALVDEAQEAGLEEIHIQATGNDVEALYASGMDIAGLWDHAIVKVPLTQDGLEAATRLRKNNVSLTLTAAYADHQMLAAIALNAAYIAPYYGRLLETGEDADTILERMRSIRNHSGSSTRILVASLRNVEQLTTLATLGHDTFTLSPSVAEKLAINEMSDKSAEAFEACCD